MLAHFLRLTEEDCRLRFRRYMTSAAIEGHVAALDFDDAIRLGLEDAHGTLVAMVEGFVFGPPGRTTMEVAFSTDPGWRRLGLAHALGQAIGDAAVTRGVVGMVAHLDPRNAPMKSLLRTFEADMERDEDELRATWTPVAAACFRPVRSGPGSAPRTLRHES